MNADIRSFVNSVAGGAIAGGAPFMIATVPMAIIDAFQQMTGKPNLGGDLYLAVLPVLVSSAVVLFGSIVVGIPSVIILRRNGWETPRRYIFIGAVGGLAILGLGLSFAGADWGTAAIWGVVGAFTGGVTARIWAKATTQTA